MAHDIPYKKKPPPDVWGMNKKKSPYGITQSDGIIDETFGPEGPSTAYSNNSQYPPIQQPIQGANAMASDYQNFLARQKGGTERQAQPNQYTKGANLSPNSWNNAFNWFGGMTLPPGDENDSYTDQTLGEFDPFQDFKWGMNMPTFQVGKGVYDSLLGGLGAYNKFRNYGLRSDMFEDQKRIDKRDYLAATGLQNIKFDDIDFDRRERNLFKEKTMKPGGYILEDPINRRTLAS